MQTGEVISASAANSSTRAKTVVAFPYRWHHNIVVPSSNPHRRAGADPGPWGHWPIVTYQAGLTGRPGWMMPLPRWA